MLSTWMTPVRAYPCTPVVQHRLKHSALQCQQMVCSPAPHSFEIWRLDPLKSGGWIWNLDHPWALCCVDLQHPAPAVGERSQQLLQGEKLGLGQKYPLLSLSTNIHPWASPEISSLEHLPALLQKASGLEKVVGLLPAQPGGGKEFREWILGWIPAESIGLTWLGSHCSIKGVAAFTEPRAGVFLLLHNSKWINHITHMLLW